MNSAIGEIIPFAMGIAISPVPIMAAILVLLSPRARSTSLGFLIGWIIGIASATIVFTLLGSILPESDSNASKPIIGAVKIVLGALLLLLALRQWRSRPKPGEEPALPGWMTTIDSMTAARAAALAFLLAAVNPKNLILAASTGMVLSTVATPGKAVVPTIVFVVLATSTVVAPIMASLIAGPKLAEPLERLRGWLGAHNAAIMTVLLLTLGAVVLGKGIGSF